jgi:hypothetical protein
MKTRVLVAGIALMFALPLQAQERPRGPAGGRDPREMMKRADTNGDGKVSKAEFVAARSAEMEEAFTRIDASGDGFLDEKEVTEFGDRMREMAGRPGGAPGGEGPRRPGAPGRRAEGDTSSAEPMRRDGDADPGALAEQFFDRADTDSDGRLSREEYLAGASRLQEMMRRGGGGMPGLGGRAAAPEEGFRRPPPRDAAGTPPAER